jgi:hypothetical protein
MLGGDRGDGVVNAYTLANLRLQGSSLAFSKSGRRDAPSTKRPNVAPSTAQAMRMVCTDDAALSDQLACR